MNDKRGCRNQNSYRNSLPNPEPRIQALPYDPQVAMAYVPYQEDPQVYDELKALEAGTLFPVLDKPYLGMGCRR